MHLSPHTAFAGLFFVSTFARGILLSVLPLQALALFGDAQSVSLLYFCVSGAGILSSLGIPLIVRRLGCEPAFLIGATAMALSAPLLATADPVAFAGGMFVHVFAVAALEVSLSLYIMHRVRRRELARFEPKRVLFAVAALTLGPWLGVFLESRVGHALPFAVAVIAALASIAYFRWLGLHRARMPGSLTRSANPFQPLGRFFAQPRLRLAWGLTVARSAWWTMFIIYTPIYATRWGLGDLAGAAIVSIGTAWTVTVPFWGWVARRHGLGRLFTLGFYATGLLSACVFAFAGEGGSTAALLVLAALGATMLDGAGNALFFRAVHPWERSEMAGVFLTYRDASQLAPPGLFALLLNFFTVPIVFLAASGWMLIAAAYCRYIPRRM